MNLASFLKCTDDILTSWYEFNLLFLLKKETIMFAMAYTILKLHRKALLKMGRDELFEFLHKRLETDFGFDDDYVIAVALKESLAELRSSRLHTAGPPPDNEKPQKPFGLHRFGQRQLCKEIDSTFYMC